MSEPTEVLNNDNDVVARIMIHNVGDGVQVLLVPTGTGTVKGLMFMAGVNIAKTITVGLRRRPGGRVAEVKRS
jgi:hypothetical protein